MHKLKPVYAQAAWASITCLGWSWCSAFTGPRCTWSNAQRQDRPHRREAPPQDLQHLSCKGCHRWCRAWLCPSQASRRWKVMSGKRRYVKQWQQVITVAVALNVKNIVNTSADSISSWFLVVTLRISVIGTIRTIQWGQLLWIDSHSRIGIWWNLYIYIMSWYILGR